MKLLVCDLDDFNKPSVLRDNEGSQTAKPPYHTQQKLLPYCLTNNWSLNYSMESQNVNESNCWFHRHAEAGPGAGSGCAARCSAVH